MSYNRGKKKPKFNTTAALIDMFKTMDAQTENMPPERVTKEIMDVLYKSGYSYNEAAVKIQGFKSVIFKDIHLKSFPLQNYYREVAELISKIKPDESKM